MFDLQDETLRSMSHGPLRSCVVYPAYFVNGYKFNSLAYGANKSSQNSGVCVKGSNYSETSYDYYGQLEEVIEIEYFGQLRIALFKCKWFDPTPNVGTRVHRRTSIVEVHRNRRFNKYEPFILASQACQVYFLPYPTLLRERQVWLAVCKVQPRFADEQIVSNDYTHAQNDDDAYQEEQQSDGVELVEVSEECIIRTYRDPNGGYLSDYVQSDENEEVVNTSSDCDNDVETCNSD